MKKELLQLLTEYDTATRDERCLKVGEIYRPLTLEGFMTWLKEDNR